MDNMPNLYVRELENSRYSETSALANLLYDGYPSSIELPMQQGSTMGDTNFDVRKHDHNPCKDEKSQVMFVQTDGEEDFLHSNVTEISVGRQLDMIIGQNLSLQQPDVSTISSQGLSLSLGTRIPFLPPLHYGSTCSSSSCRDENYHNETLNATGSEYNRPNLGCVISTSKYLNAAQELLEEVVSAQRTMKPKSEKSRSLQTLTIGSREFNAGSKDKGMSSSDPSDSAIDSSTSELSPTERLDLQNKVTRLSSMLHEVDIRYQQYFKQMQTLASSLDAFAGAGAAKPYTTVALHTISSHFRGLRDAISTQIQIAKTSLGEPDNSGGGGGGKSTGISRLRHIDHQLRQQQQQFGFGLNLMQQQQQQHPLPWRPQRGLPDSSLSILRAWLFEHFLHPYPGNAEKLMLARQTGLTRGQISNWFINARVRLWKPMVEDMYKEEIGDGDAEIGSNSFSSENLHKGQEDSQNTVVTENNRESSFVGYPMDELSNYAAAAAAGDRVSLTLGLHNCDGGLPASDHHHPSFAGALGQDIYDVAAPMISGVANNTTAYDYSSIRDRQQQFSSPHPLRDFVACKVRYT